MKSFDDLFDEFFNEKKPLNSLHDEIKKIIDSLANFKKPEPKLDFKTEIGKMDNEEQIAKFLGIDLSNPTSVEEFTENGLKFSKLTWETPRGRFVKVVVSDVIDGDTALMSTGPKAKSLEEQLQEAVDNEDYELAITLRDKIKSQKKVEKKSA